MHCSLADSLGDVGDATEDASVMGDSNGSGMTQFIAIWTSLEANLSCAGFHRLWYRNYAGSEFRPREGMMMSF